MLRYTEYFCLIALAVVSLSCSVTAPGDRIYDLAIHDVRVFDSQHKTVAANKVILIRADTIAAVLETHEAYRANRVLQGRGRLVTPGFIDTHTHLNLILQNAENTWPATLAQDSSDYYRSIYADQFLRYGTTSIVDMGMPEAWMEETLRWQHNPSARYPNLYVGGGAMISDEERNPYMNHTEITGAASGRQKVQRYADMGVRHIKLYWRLRTPEMRAITQEALGRDVLMFGHIDVNIVSIQQAMELGVRNFEHFMTLPASIFIWSEHWRGLSEKYGMPGIGTMDEYAAMMVFFFQYIQDIPEFDASLNRLLDDMAQEGASISTTIHILGSSAERTFFFSSFEHFPERQTPILPGYTPETRALLQGAFDTMMRYLKRAHDKGVMIRIGTDCKYGGKALLSEMMLLAEAEFPMEDVLQIATWNGYKAMNLTDRYGTIEPGKKADLVLFDANPFDDYTNLRSDKVIIKDGVIQRF